jgi:hypothetical protein
MLLEKLHNVFGGSDRVCQRDEIIRVSSTKRELLDKALRVVTPPEKKYDALSESFIFDKSCNEILATANNVEGSGW